MPASVIKFEGLMVFHRDRRRGGCEVGILPVRSVERYPDHEFKITVTPDPETGRGSRVIEGAEIDRFRGAGGGWRLDVVNARTGQSRDGIDMNPELPDDRHDPNGDLHDFGWIMDVESSEFHDSPLPRIAPGRLNPIIYLSSGRLYTFCKTDGIEVRQKDDRSLRHFGFIAETLALGIDTGPGDEIVLGLEGAGEEGAIFRLPHREGVNYQVTIENTEPMAHAGIGGEMSDHFQLYYELLFPDVPSHERFHLSLTRHSEPSPNPCAAIMQGHGGAEEAKEMRTVYPYKCGGIYLSLTDAPLS